MTVPPFILASASPARLRLLRNAGFAPVVRVSEFDESQVQVGEPGELVNTLALCKAQTVAVKFPDALILGCDSVLVVNGEIYGKPKDEQEAIARWRIMQNHWGELFTGHALMDGKQQKTLIRCQVTQVYFAPISDDVIAKYVATGEPLNCAGCFALEGKGGLFVERLVGCHSNVIGLSMPLLRHLLAELGYAVTDFWVTPED